jgi:subtilisin family serine protease
MRIPHVRYVILCLMLLVLISPGSAIDQQALSNLPDNAYPAQYAEQGTAELSDQMYANDEIFVRFTPGAASRASASRLHAQIGATVKKDFTPYGLQHLQVVKIPGHLTVPEAIEYYSRNPNVLYAEPNYLIQATVLPDDYLFNELWGLHNTGQTGGTSDCDIDAPEAWDLTHGSSDVIVAVIDSGVDYTHPDLAANIWKNTGEIAGDGKDNDNNGYIDDVVGWDFANNDNNPVDDNGHGTHCAGTIGAVGNNGIGVAGVMWTARIMPLKFLDAGGSGYTDDAVSAVLYANSNGAHVISNSWGGGGYSQSLKDAIDQSTAVVACAAGNSRRNINNVPFYPASYTSPQIIAVAATDDNDDLASFSNYGTVSVDVAAPGVDIVSTYKGGLYARMSGTSMANPHVAGLAGAIQALYPEMTNLQIKERIMDSVDQDAALARKVASGGRINAYNALVSTSIVPPTAGFTVSTASGVAPLPVQFTDTSTGSIDAWNWNFGDGDSSTEQNPTHTYTVAGTYTAQLTVSNDGGTSTTGTEITVTAPVEPVLTSIAVTPASWTLDIDETQQFTATGYDQNDAVMPVTATWSSTSAGVATIDPTTGLLTAVGAGTCTVTATSADVSGSATVTVNPAGDSLPTITSLDPGSLLAGSAKFKLTVGGTNFVSGAKVFWNGAERKTTYLSSTQLQAWILRPDVANAGSYPITVRNPDGKLSDAVSFIVTAT